MRNERLGVSIGSLLLATLGLLSAMILIANVGGTELGGDQYDPSGTIDDIVTVLFPIALVLWILMLVYLIYNVYARGKKGHGKEPGKDTNIDQRWMVVILVIVMAIGLGLLLYSGSWGGDRPLPGPGDGGNGTTDPVPGEESPGTQVSSWSLVGLVIVGVVLLVPVLRYLHGQGVFSRTKPPGKPEWNQTQVIEEAMAGIIGSTGDELRDAIIGAYHAMCHLLPGGPSEVRYLTPREFADRAIVHLGWPAGPVNELTGIFELARYSHHPLGETERGRALACLEDIKEALGQEVSVAAGTAKPTEG